MPMQKRDRTRLDETGNRSQDPVDFGPYSSPPCFMHELDPTYLGLPVAESASPSGSEPPETADWPTIQRWRKETRATLIARRLALSGQDRAERSARIGERLKSALLSARGTCIGFYWPFRGEFDARALLVALREQGARLALPVVVEKGRPLEFREWWPGVPMTRGVWDIPIPAAGQPVSPNVLVAPLVGFDEAHCRLGYGGGFYDRTIASMRQTPRLIGVGFELGRLKSIHPQPHDIPMDIIITERM
jgi:5-formyltetrahydrofolate cyclo-ligase